MKRKLDRIIFNGLTQSQWLPDHSPFYILFSVFFSSFRSEMADAQWQSSRCTFIGVGEMERRQNEKPNEIISRWKRHNSAARRWMTQSTQMEEKGIPRTQTHIKRMIQCDFRAEFKSLEACCVLLPCVCNKCVIAQSLCAETPKRMQERQVRSARMPCR